MTDGKTKPAKDLDKRECIVKRIARELQQSENGMLGIGPYPTPHPHLKTLAV